MCVCVFFFLGDKGSVGVHPRGVPPGPQGWPKDPKRRQNVPGVQVQDDEHDADRQEAVAAPQEVLRSRRRRSRRRRRRR